MTGTIELCGYPNLDPRVSVLRAGSEVDAMVVRTRRFVALIDTLATPRQCREALELVEPDLAGRPLLVVNSHMDWDHFWGNQAIGGRAPIIAHAAARDRIRDPSAAQTLRDKARAEARFGGIELTGPTVTFDGSMTLDGGDLTLELIFTPGHTPDHVAVWIPELKLCLAVDAVEDPIPGVWSTRPEDLRSLRASIDRIGKLGAQMILPAHGQTSDPAIAARNLAYFDELARRVHQLPVGELQDEGLADRTGLAFEDIISRPLNLSIETREFYRQCHATNLAATVNTRLREIQCE